MQITRNKRAPVPFLHPVEVIRIQKNLELLQKATLANWLPAAVIATHVGASKRSRQLALALHLSGWVRYRPNVNGWRPWSYRLPANTLTESTI